MSECIVWVCVRTLLFQQTSIQSWGSRSLDIEIEMASSNGNFPASMPVLVGKNYDDWCAQMKLIFRFQDVIKWCKKGLKNLTRTQLMHKKWLTVIWWKKIQRHCLLFISVYVDADNFQKIRSADIVKQTWDTLEKSYGGDS